jgi:cardiolipin synthase (CMP-forming)
MLRRDHSMRIFTISNLLTASRLVLTPFIVAALLKHLWGLALVLFFLAGVSDLLDGFIARLFNEPTWLGSVLDPIADKFLVVSSLFAFFLSSPKILLPTWFVVIIASRETILLLGGAFLFFTRRSFQIRPNFFGKTTTCMILVLMMLVLLSATFGYPLGMAKLVLMYGVLGCAGVSFAQYCYVATCAFLRG